MLSSGGRNIPEIEETVAPKFYKTSTRSHA
jgi:hypothetical protein